MGVLTDFFATTESELRAYYPGWKLPLEQPIRIASKNPFTGESAEAVSWDPDPERPVEDVGPPGPPSPSIDLKGLGHTSVISLIGIVHDSSAQAEESFMRLALIGPEEGPWINELPPAFVAKLAKLDGADRDRVAEAWTSAERADIAGIKDEFTRNRMLADHDLGYWRGMLDELADFARTALSQGHRVYMWTCL